MTKDSPASHVYARADDVIGTEVDGTLVLVSTVSWSYFEFDQTARKIWTLLEQPRSLPGLVDALMKEFDVEESVCMSDTKAFLDEMIAQGVVAAA